MKQLAIAFAGLALAAGCSFSNRGDPTGPLRPGAETLDDTVTVTLARSAVTRDGAVRIGFLEKLDDSRCPRNVVCIWAGDVGAVLRVETLELATEGKVRTALQPRFLELGDYQITLLDMTPYPGDGVTRQPAASVRVVRAPR